MERALTKDKPITRWEIAKDYPLYSIKDQGYQLTKPTVSVIIPTLNEAKNLPLILPYLPMDWVDEVILVDGRSTDGTVEIAQQILPSVKVVLEKKKGKGAAMYAGYQAASSDILLVMDADGSNDPREIPRYIKPLLEGADFVKGSRFAPGGGTTDMSRVRKFGNGTFVLLSNMLFGTSFSDLCYGYHAFWRYCLDNLQLADINGFEIDTVLYLQALRRKMRIVEVPSFEGYRFYGEGKLQTIPDGVRVLKTIFLEWVAGMKEKQPDLYLGFRGIVPNPSNSFVIQDYSSITKQAELEMEFLRLFSKMLFVGFNLKEALQRVLQLTIQALDAQSGSIMVLDENGGVKQVCLGYEGKYSLDCTQQTMQILQQGLAGWVMRNREAALVPNTREEPRWLRRDWDTCCVPRSALAIPLIFNSQVFAVLTLVRPEPKHFTEDDLYVLREIALSN